MADSDKFLKDVDVVVFQPSYNVLKLEGGAGAGKTAAALGMVSWLINKQEEVVAYIDRDLAADPRWYKSFGIPIDDPDLFMVIQPNTNEKTLDLLRVLLQNKATVVIDGLHPFVGPSYTLVMVPNGVLIEESA